MGTILQPGNLGAIRTIWQICEEVLMSQQPSPRLAFFESWARSKALMRNRID
jgi:hypothetical protein